MKQDLNVLLEQFTRHNGRGNMIATNATMLEIVQTLVEMINQPCSNCKCQTLPPLDLAPKVPIREPVVETILDPADETMALPIEQPIKRGVGRPRKL